MEDPYIFQLFITHVEGDGPFLRISGQIDRESLGLVEKALEKCRDELDGDVGVIQPSSAADGLLCAVKYKDGVYYRVKIISTNDIERGIVGVKFIDYGNKDLVSLNSARLLDKQEILLTQISPLAEHFFLWQLVNPGRWDESTLLNLQNLLCYAEYPAVVKGFSNTLPFVQIVYKGQDLSKYLQNLLGLYMVVDQPVMVRQDAPGPSANWPSFNPAEIAYPEVYSYFYNQNFPSNIAASMRLTQSRPRNNTAFKAPRAVSLRPLSRHPLAPDSSNPPPPRYTTVSLPASSPSKVKTVRSRMLEINSSHKVFVPYVEEGPEFFVVQLVSEIDNLFAMMEEINSRPHQSLREPPMTGTLCLGRMTVDRLVCRAIVMNICGSQCKLYFIDFGDTEVISYYDIFDIPDEFVTPPIFGMRFTLAGLKKVPKNHKTAEIFKKLVEDKIVLLKVVTPEGPPLIQYGELYLKDDVNVLDLLINQQPMFSIMKLIPVGDSTLGLVSYVHSCSKFYIHLSSLINNLNMVMEDMKKHCETTSPLTEVSVGMACCALFPEDGKWYRASVLQVDGSKITVFYVDYGNKQEVELSDLRTITLDLTQLPALAMQCALKDFADKGEDHMLSNQLEMLVLEKTFTIYVEGMVAEDTMLVTLTDEKVSPPLSIGQVMSQLSKPKSQEMKTSLSSRYDSEATNDRRRPPKADENKRSPPFLHPPTYRSKSRPNEIVTDYTRMHSSTGAIRKTTSPSYRENQDTSRPTEQRSYDQTKSARGEASERKSRHREATGHRRREDRTQEHHGRARTRDDHDVADTSRGDRAHHRRVHFENSEHNARREYSSRNSASSRAYNSRDGPSRREHNPKRDFRDRQPSTNHDNSFDSNTSNNNEQFKLRGRFTQVKCKQLSNPQPLNKPFQELSFDLTTQHEVTVTWMITPENFFNQFLSYNPKFLEMMHKIPEVYRGVPPYEGPISEGDSVLARFPEDGVLYRATVVSVQPLCKYVVQYVDFGNKHLVESRDIWQLDDWLMELPKLAVRCTLVGVKPKDGPWKATADLDRCFNGPRFQCVFIEKVDDVYQVAMYKNSVSIADLLIEKGFAESNAAPEAATAVELKDEQIDWELIKGNTYIAKVTSIESVSKYFIQIDLEKMALIEKLLANASLKPVLASDLVVQMPCAVAKQDKVYRAYVDSTNATIAKLHLYDYGMYIEVTHDQIMYSPAEVGCFYPQAIECRLTASTEPLMTLEQMQEILLGNNCIVQVDAIDSSRLVTTLYSLENGEQIKIADPWPGVADKVSPLCPRAVYNYNFGLAYIAHAQKLTEIYLHKSTDIEGIGEMLNNLYKYYEEGTEAEPLSEYVLDSLCAAKSSDGNWYRAVIVTVEDQTVEVQFPDYGNFEVIAKDSIKKLVKQFYEPCARALSISLGLESLSDTALLTLKELISDKEVQVTLSSRIEPGRWLANLHFDGDDLAIKLINLGFCTPIPAFEGQSEACSLVYVSHIDSPGQFWLQMPAMVDDIEVLQEELQASANDFPDLEKRELGTVCAVQYSSDEQWYRAVLLDVATDIATVRFIDYGNADVILNPAPLKQLPERLAAMPAGAVKASVNAVPTGTGEWSEPATELFTKLLGDRLDPFSANIVLNGLTTYIDLYVDGKNVTDALVAEGHATKSDCSSDLPTCYASHVNSPAEFWIQLESSTEELQSMESELALASDWSELAVRVEGVVCAAKFNDDGLYYRAQIIVDTSEGTEVFFMDYGNASISNDLRLIPGELVSKPALAKKCALQKPRYIKTWSRQAEEKFNEIAAEGATILKVQFIAFGDISVVELYLDGKSITEILVALCEEESKSIERSVPLKDEKIYTGKLTFVESTKTFFIMLEEHEEKLKDVRKQLERASEFESLSSLEVGTVCAALSEADQTWYRGKVLQSADADTLVQFIDNGNRVSCTQIKQLPESLSAMEPLAKRCSLVASEESLVAKLNTMLEGGSSIQVIFLDRAKDPAVVKLMVDGMDTFVTEQDPNSPECTETITDQTNVDDEITNPCDDATSFIEELDDQEHPKTNGDDSEELNESWASYVTVLSGIVSANAKDVTGDTRKPNIDDNNLSQILESTESVDLSHADVDDMTPEDVVEVPPTTQQGINSEESTVQANKSTNLVKRPDDNGVVIDTDQVDVLDCLHSSDIAEKKIDQLDMNAVKDDDAKLEIILDDALSKQTSTAESNEQSEAISAVSVEVRTEKRKLPKKAMLTPIQEEHISSAVPIAAEQAIQQECISSSVPITGLQVIQEENIPSAVPIAAEQAIQQECNSSSVSITGLQVIQEENIPSGVPIAAAEQDEIEPQIVTNDN